LILENKNLAEFDTNTSKSPNGLNVKLQSVSFYGKLIPKEIMAITMINQKELIESDFYNSHCWSKLKSIVFCALKWSVKMRLVWSC
jgi:hypothetical protein